jgi:uncharacterized protein
VLTLYQTEWCPFSSAVREVLTELGVDFVARQVEPWPDERNELQAVAARSPSCGRRTDGFTVARERSSRTCASSTRGSSQRLTAAGSPTIATPASRMRRGSWSSISGRAKSPEEVAGYPADADVVDVPEANRYELRLADRLIGLAAYRRRDGRIAFTHTEVDESCEGRGFGSRLAAAALADARRQGLVVVPLCPFIARYIERHPEYEELLALG